MSSVRRYARSFVVRCSAHHAYAHWRDHAILAADFSHGVHAMMHGARTRWRADWNDQTCIWETVCTADVPGRLLTWTTATSEHTRHSWDFWFAERADGWGTDIELVVVLESADPDDDAPPVFSDPLLDPEPDHTLDQLILLWQARLAQAS